MFSLSGNGWPLNGTFSQRGSEDVLNKKLEEMNGDLRKSESRNNALNTDLKKATGALSSAEAECTALKTKLQELEKHLSASDANKEMGAKLQVGGNYSGTYPFVDLS